MTHHVPPKDSAFINGLERISWKGEKRWRDASERRIYCWDELHGELEVFTYQGYHLGSVDPYTGRKVKDAIKGRRIDV